MPLKVRFLRKCHTKKRRGRRIIKTKQWKSRRHRRCIERRSLFAHFFSNFMTKAFIRKVIKNQYATPPSLFVPSAPPWYCVTSVPSVTPCAYYIRRLVYHSISRKNQKQATSLTFQTNILDMKRGCIVSCYTLDTASRVSLKE